MKEVDLLLQLRASTSLNSSPAGCEKAFNLPSLVLDEEESLLRAGKFTTLDPKTFITEESPTYSFDFAFPQPQYRIESQSI